MFDIVRNTASHDLNELVDKGMLEKTKYVKQMIYNKII